jgi:hypothetical protein
MSTRQRAISFAGRSAVIATIAALALSTVGPTSAFAGGRHWRGGGGAAAGAAFAAIVGTGVAIAAAQNRAAAYDDAYAYYGGPVYAPAPVVVVPYGGYGYYGGYDPAYGPNHWGADTPYVNGHPLASW